MNEETNPTLAERGLGLFAAYSDLLESRAETAVADAKAQTQLALNRARLRRDLRALDADFAQQEARLSARGLSGSGLEALDQDQVERLTARLETAARDESAARRARLEGEAKRRRSLVQALAGLWG